MVKHTQTICRLLPRNCLSVFDHFVGTSLTEMRAQKWKNMKNRKAQTFARIEPVVDSNLHRNERVMYYANVLLHF